MTCFGLICTTCCDVGGDDALTKPRGWVGGPDPYSDGNRSCEFAQVVFLGGRLVVHEVAENARNLKALCCLSDFLIKAVNVSPLFRNPGCATVMVFFTRRVSFFAGEAYFRTDDLSRAELNYRRALQLKPDHVPAYLTLAKLHQAKVGFHSVVAMLFNK